MFKSKKGNVILVVVGVFAILALALGSFLKTTVNRKYSAQKLGDSMYAKELANSLAVLAIDYIKEQLRDSANGDEKIRKAFSLPWDYTGNDIKGSIELSKLDILDSLNGQSLIDTLQQESNLKDFTVIDKKINWKLSDIKPIRVGDEETGTIPYPREKLGLININFKVW